MPSEVMYPYKLRVQFTHRAERGLKAAAERNGTSINDTIRRYVSEGLKRDGLHNLSEPVSDDQTAIDI